MPKPRFIRKNPKPKALPPLKPGKLNYQGEGGGKPPTYASEKELAQACYSYFESFTRGKKLFDVPSKAGLLVHLDISRTQYSVYRKKYPNAIRRADGLIEEAWVRGLNGANATGRIFYLKNAFRDDYQDRMENDLTSKGEKLSALAVIQAETRKILEGDASEKK